MYIYICIYTYIYIHIYFYIELYIYINVYIYIYHTYISIHLQIDLHKNLYIRTCSCWMVWFDEWASCARVCCNNSSCDSSMFDLFTKSCGGINMGINVCVDINIQIFVWILTAQKWVCGTTCLRRRQSPSICSGPPALSHTHFSEFQWAIFENSSVPHTKFFVSCGIPHTLWVCGKRNVKLVSRFKTLEIQIQFERACIINSFALQRCSCCDLAQSHPLVGKSNTRSSQHDEELWWAQSMQRGRPGRFW